MHTSTPTRTRRALAGTATGLAVAAFVLVAPVAASAHVHVTPSSTEPGAMAQLDFTFSHGCDGSPTTAVEVAVPDEIASVALIANPGWDVAAEAVDGARTVVFTADEPMPDGVRETLELEVTLPGGGSLLIDGSRIPGEFVNWCRAGGRVQRAEAAENELADTAPPSARPEPVEGR